MKHSKKKVLFYCQHVLGMGHLIRSREIVHALKDFEVCFLNGGELIPGFEFDPRIEVVNLPPMKSDAAFKDIQSSVGNQTLEQVKSARTQRILAEYERIQPDVLIIELFPFGRRKFAFELIPLLSRIRLNGDQTKVVCSLRDILVSKRDQQRHEDQVLNTMNRYFDLLLIHSDPKFQRLDETFSRMTELRCPAKYTGFVAEAPSKEALYHHPDDRFLNDDLNRDTAPPLILASIGGGRVGLELLECSIQASLLLKEDLPHRLLIFSGPYLPEDDFLKLERMIDSHSNIQVRKYTTHFLAYMTRADLSISMAGYNTCMNILVAKTKALLLPFTGNQNEEQTIRAEKLEALGLATVISSQNLEPVSLSEKIKISLLAGPMSAHLEVDGAQKASAFLSELLSKKDQKTIQASRSGLKPLDSQFKASEAILRPALERLVQEKKEIRIFLRDDDATDDLETLRHLFDVTLASSVPLNLEIIPGELSAGGIRLLDNHKHLHPDLFELNQHGWQHHNHEKEGRKYEFGPSRSFDQQFEDISKGKSRLEEVFGHKFYPVFTPPWNRCTDDTFRVLDRLGFKVFSKDRGKQTVRNYAFQEISTTLDLYHWKGKPEMKAPEAIVAQLLEQMQTGEPIGILSHHKVMNLEAFSFLDFLLRTLRPYPNIQFHTFEGLSTQSIHNEGLG